MAKKGEMRLWKRFILPLLQRSAADLWQMIVILITLIMSVNITRADKWDHGIDLSYLDCSVRRQTYDKCWEAAKGCGAMNVGRDWRKKISTMISKKSLKNTFIQYHWNKWVSFYICWHSRKSTETLLFACVSYDAFFKALYVEFVQSCQLYTVCIHTCMSCCCHWW